MSASIRDSHEVRALVECSHGMALALTPGMQRCPFCGAIRINGRNQKWAYPHHVAAVVRAYHDACPHAQVVDGQCADCDAAPETIAAAKNEPTLPVPEPPYAYGKKHCGDVEKCEKEPYSEDPCNCYCATRCGPWNDHLETKPR